VNENVMKREEVVVGGETVRQQLAVATVGETAKVAVVVVAAMTETPGVDEGIVIWVLVTLADGKTVTWGRAGMTAALVDGMTGIWIRDEMILIRDRVGMIGTWDHGGMMTVGVVMTGVLHLEKVVAAAGVIVRESVREVAVVVVEHGDVEARRETEAATHGEAGVERRNEAEMTQTPGGGAETQNQGRKELEMMVGQRFVVEQFIQHLATLLMLWLYTSHQMNWSLFLMIHI